MVNQKDSSISNIHAENQKTLQQLYKEKEKKIYQEYYTQLNYVYNWI